jgi:hypothetical protein
MNISENENFGLLSFIVPIEANGLQLMSKMEVIPAQPAQRQTFAPLPCRNQRRIRFNSENPVAGMTMGAED